MMSSMLFTTAAFSYSSGMIIARRINFHPTSMTMTSNNNSITSSLSVPLLLSLLSRKTYTQHQRQYQEGKEVPQLPTLSYNYCPPDIVVNDDDGNANEHSNVSNNNSRVLDRRVHVYKSYERKKHHQPSRWQLQSQNHQQFRWMNSSTSSSLQSSSSLSSDVGFGDRLRELLDSNNSTSSLSSSDYSSNLTDEESISSWKQAEDVLRLSLQEIRILRSRIENNRNHQNGNDETTIPLATSMIYDCIRLLDRLAQALPPAEEYSSWLLLYGDRPHPHHHSCTSVLETELLNEILKEWLMALETQNQSRRRRNQQQQQQQQQQQHRLPTPTYMAEKVDQYRSCMLIQPNSTSFNMLLNSMISNNTSQSQSLIGIKLADDYIRRLLQVQQQQQQQQQQSDSLSSVSSPTYVDIISFTTVMKGWVNQNQPDKAQEWLDQIITLSKANIPNIPRPNAIAYAIVIQGWTKQGDVVKAESILLASIQDELDKEDDDNDHDYDVNITDRIVDRVVFHTVIDAWAAKAARSVSGAATTTIPNKSNKTNKKMEQKYIGTDIDDGDVTYGKDTTTSIIIPALRAKEIVDTMQDLADNHKGLEYLYPNDETWYKLISAIALQQDPSPLISPHITTTSDDDNDNVTKKEDAYGPKAAEEILQRIEDETGNLAPAIVLNRILRAYCTSESSTGGGVGLRGMDDAEAFYHRRIRKQKEESVTSSPFSFPDEITFNTILTGWANTAAESSSSPSKRSKIHDDGDSNDKVTEIPIRAEAWLDEMRRYDIEPSTRSYGAVLHACCAIAKLHRDDAPANRAEEILKKNILSCPEHFVNNNNGDGADTTMNTDPALGITICTNIVLRAWSNLTSPPKKKKKRKNKKSANDENDDGGSTRSSGTEDDSDERKNQIIISRRAVGRCIRLLEDYLLVVDKKKDKLNNNLKPTVETFRSVLHAIISSENKMHLTEKYNLSKYLFVDVMKDKYRINFLKDDRKKLDRLFNAKESMMLRKQKKWDKKNVVQEQQQERGQDQE